MRTRRGGQTSPLLFDYEIEQTARNNGVRRRLINMCPSSVTVEYVTNEPMGEVSGGAPFISPVSEYHIGSMSASGGAVSAPVPSCTQPLVQPLGQPVINPLGNFVSTAMALGAPTHDGNPLPR
ncbi:hypothetical protein L1887_15785 [Cichorium endivia]|nr:hypothetical protein L1887_15785 [Cichorium endivia]